MIDFGKEIHDNEVLVVVCSENYQKILMDVIKEAEKRFEKLCFVTLNKPYNNLAEILKKNNIDIKKFSFIDAITSTVVKPGSAKNCVFVTAPNALTELNIAITKECKNFNPRLFIFDSLSNLLVYEKGPVLIEFVHSVIQSVKMYKIKIIFTALKSDIDSALMKDLSMFADKVIQMG